MRKQKLIRRLHAMKLSSAAYAVLLFPYPLSAACYPEGDIPSATCPHRVLEEERPVSILEISRWSVPLMMDLIPPWHTGGRVATNSLKSIPEESDRARIFVRFDVSAYHDIHSNSDCFVYADYLEGQLREPLRPLVFQDDCTGAVISIFRSLLATNDLLTREAMLGLYEGDVLDISDEMTWDLIRETSFFSTIVGTAFHGLDQIQPNLSMPKMDDEESYLVFEDWEQRFPEVIDFFRLIDTHPTSFEHITVGYESAWHIVEAYTGAGIQVGEIYVVDEHETLFSIADIPNPERLPPGTRLRVPVQMAEWRYKSINVDEIENVAIEIYGSPLFGLLIKRICALDGAFDACVLPIFHDPSPIERGIRAGMER
jgi:hypothetical protein